MKIALLEHQPYSIKKEEEVLEILVVLQKV